MATNTAQILDELDRATSVMSVALCGSFRRDPEGLRATWEELRRHYLVVTPTSLDFVDPDAEFVRLGGEHDESIAEIEGRHLAAVARADFVWLHAPHGYVGASATLEIGHARALGVPVFAASPPVDQTVASFVQVVDAPAVVAGLLQSDPGSGLAALQSYYGRVALRRGWSEESPRDTLLLITEEVGELARAVRKSEGLARDAGYDGVNAADELADVQLYLVHLANSLGIDLARAVSEKERANAKRHAEASAA